MLTAADRQMLAPAIHCEVALAEVLSQPGITVERPGDSIALLQVGRDAVTVHCYVGKDVVAYALELCGRFPVCRYNSLRPGLARLLARSVNVRRVGEHSWEFNQ